MSTWPFTQPPTIIFGSEGQNSKAKMSSGHSSSNCKKHRKPTYTGYRYYISKYNFPRIGCLPSQVFIYSSLTLQSSAFNPQSQVHTGDSISSGMRGKRPRRARMALQSNHFSASCLNLLKFIISCMTGIQHFTLCNSKYIYFNYISSKTYPQLL